MATTVEESRHTTARLAGFLYLLTTLAANFTEFYVRGRLNVRGNAVETARNIAASGQLFRIGIAGDLVTLVGSVALVAALYVILKPISRNIALVAAFWWLVECSVAAVVILNNYATLLLLTGAASMPALHPEQLPALARFLINLDTSGNRIAALFFGLGSAAFCYLWYRSRYIPRALAALGILASLVPAVIPFTMMMMLNLQDFYLRKARTGIPIVIFQVILGLWLLVKGIRTTDDRITTATLEQA
jgi:Domain of unknown function (DUF4386)